MTFTTGTEKSHGVLAGENKTIQYPKFSFLNLPQDKPNQKAEGYKDPPVGIWSRMESGSGGIWHLRKPDPQDAGPARENPTAQGAQAVSGFI